MKQGITIAELSDLLEARMLLLHCQKWLHRARVAGQPRWVVEVFEKQVGLSLDNLWEAQQQCQE